MVFEIFREFLWNIDARLSSSHGTSIERQSSSYTTSIQFKLCIYCFIWFILVSEASFTAFDCSCPSILYTSNLRPVSSSFSRLHIFLEQVIWVVDFVTINFVILVLLDWTSTSCAITFLVIWHILCIMLACFTSNQSRYIFQLFLIIDIYWSPWKPQKT